MPSAAIGPTALKFLLILKRPNSHFADTLKCSAAIRVLTSTPIVNWSSSSSGEHISLIELEP
jgi:hypothetical protein